MKLLDDIRGIDPAGKDTVALYNEISELAMAEIARRRAEDCGNGRQACYLSMEFLVGRSFFNNLLELGVLDEVRSILAGKGIDLSRFEEIEDAALGNGGLGRLAACFLDSAAGLGLPLSGFGIRYRFGLFRQSFEDGFQRERPDDWQSFGDPWSERREDQTKIVRFDDLEVKAVPYDMPIVGKRINTLRLFQAEGSPEAEEISQVLYPADNDDAGKLLRIRQEYFFSAAAVGTLIDSYVKEHGKNFERFPELFSIQLNDTHPVLAIAEFLRLLTVEHGVRFEEALKLAKRTFNYTNHTILPEALECWEEKLLRKILPEIAELFVELDRAAREEEERAGATAEEIERMAIRSDGKFAMANAAVFVAGKVNGVARIHSEILKRVLFAPAFRLWPEKFLNETNGVTQRRWLMLCNEELSELIDREIGPGWREDMQKISSLEDMISEKLLNDLTAVKQVKKRQLAEYVRKKEGVCLLENATVFAQVKRLHEYKRQLMTAFAILRIWFDLKSGKLDDFPPAVFLFGAKAAPGYARAKGIIKFINEIAARVNSDPETKDLLQVVFVQNYDVSYAEKIVAGSDVSLQVSTAGFEASGTGNMKFMMNAAVTLGTMDGANIEIVERAGRENNYIFGLTARDVFSLRESYDPKKLLENADISQVVQTLVDGTFSDGGTGVFRELYASLTEGTDWHKPDCYFVLRDLDGFVGEIVRANRDRSDRPAFSRKMLENLANSAYFSADRTIEGYAADIWRLGK